MIKHDTKDKYISYFSSLHEIVNKEDKICELCTGKTVLDLGCIDHSYDTAIKLGDNWLHKRIKGVAKEVTGVDILPNDIKKLIKAGYKIVNADVEKLNLKRKFDVIIAGDLIEHLSNIGLFFERVKTHMHKNSILVVSTPNPFNIEQFLSILFDNSVKVNPEHTVWIDPKVMFETVKRTGLSILEFYWVRTRFVCNPQHYSLVSTVLSRVLRKLRPSFERDYIVVLRK